MRTAGNLKSKTDMVAWASIPFAIPQPKNKTEYNSLVRLLDYLLDHVGENEEAPLAAVADLVGTLIEAYETANVPELRNLSASRRTHTRTRTRR